MNESTTSCDERAVLRDAIAAGADPTAIVVTGDDGVTTLAWVNRTFSDAVRVAPDELPGQPLGDFVWGADQLPFNELRSSGFPLTVGGRDGTTTSWEATAVPTSDGGRTCWVLTLRPPAGRDLDELLTTSEERFRALAERAPVGIFSSEAGLRLGYVNDWLADLLGVPAERLLGTAWMERVHPEDLEAVATGLQETLMGIPLELPCRLETAGEELRWVNLRAVGVQLPGRPATFLGTVEDVTERRRFEDLLAWQATHDPLTGLPNRAELTTEISEAIGAGADRTAVLFIDLDGFKEVNDTMGHAAGDALLVAVADRLRYAVRGDDVVFRLAGDEFVILARDVLDDAEALALAERLRRAVARPVKIGDVEVRLGCSVGVVRAGPTISADEMLRDADVAMYEAKRDGKGRTAMLDQSARRERDARLRFIEELRRAVATGALHVEFLPVVELDGGRTLSMEALVRWEHPERGLIEADDFLPLARHVGLMADLGRSVLSQACTAFAAWRAEGIAPDYLSVNLSTGELSDPGFMDSVTRTVLASGLTSRDLCFEIGDRDLEGGGGRMLPVLDELARLGFRLALDDVGTSFAAMAHLAHLRVDHVKIDHHLLGAARTRSESAAIARSVVGLCDELSLPTVAEGVESEEDRRWAVELGITRAQGRAVCPPLSGDAAHHWLRGDQR